ncbi:MAG: MATE family efflux transporter [Pseudomonadota bacterium]
MTTSVHPAGAGAHARALLTLGLPLVGSHLAQFAITMTDTLMIGWYSVTDLAALTIAGSIYFTLFLVGAGFAFAVMPVVATAVEQRDSRQVRRVTRMGMWLSILYGIVIIPFLVFSEGIFLAFAQEPEVAERAGLYLKIAGIGLIPNLLIMVLKSYFSALEKTQAVLFVTLAMAALNAAVNYLLIFGHFGAPELGIAGAAIASILIQMAGLAWLVAYAQRATPEFDLFRNPHRPDWDAFHQVFSLGWPIGLTSLAEVGLFTASSIMMGWIGVLELAAHGIALQIASATFMVHIGLSQAVTVRAGQALGRSDVGALRLGAGVGLSLSMAFVVLTVAAFLLVPGFLIELFLAPDEPDLEEIVRIGVLFLALAALFQVVDAAQVMALGMLRGVQDTRVPMIMAALSYWGLGIPSSYVLAFVLGWGGVGLWLGLVIGLALAAVLLSHRFWLGASVR